MKFVYSVALSIVVFSNAYCWEDHPDTEKRDLLTKEEAASLTSPDSKFSIDHDKGCNPDSRCEPKTGTFGSPDRDN